MRCPSCASETTVLESRKRETGIYRRRLCEACGSRFSTMETVIQEKRGPKPKADVSKKPAKSDTSRPRVDAKNTKPSQHHANASKTSGCGMPSSTATRTI